MAATPAIALRLILDKINDTGEDTADSFDEALSLSGLKGFVKQWYVLANGDADTAITLANDVSLLVVFSHDYKFNLRLAAGETLAQNARLYAVAADDISDTALAAGTFLLTGNGSNDSNLEIWTADKVA